MFGRQGSGYPEVLKVPSNVIEGIAMVKTLDVARLTLQRAATAVTV